MESAKAGSQKVALVSHDDFTAKPESWPALPLEAWQDTYATLHMWTQIVGKVRLAQIRPRPKVTTNRFRRIVVRWGAGRVAVSYR